MELLSPAGNLEKLATAYRYGADAAYIGIRDFSLRTRADNFDDDGFADVERIRNGKKLYCALNIYFRNADLSLLERRIENISRYPFDGFIISDPGILRIVRKFVPNAELHLSTQANCTNSEAARFYFDLGFSRIIPGRELSLSEIEEIKNAVPGLEIEVFVHGAMCLAYSGRCFLSSWMTGRSANSGDCTHSCRWKYRVLEEAEREGRYFPVIEGAGFTTILSSKDLCLIDYLREFRDAGVDALKIEGRMKSTYYTAIVTRAYRKMLDSLSGIPVDDLDAYRAELFNVSHREFSTGFYFDSTDVQIPAPDGYTRKYDFLGTVSKDLGNGRYLLDVKNSIGTKDVIEYIGPDILFCEDSGFTFLDEDGNVIDRAVHGKYCILETGRPLKEGYIVRRRAGNEIIA